MPDLLAGDLDGIEPRRDLDLLLAAVREAGGRPVDGLVNALAARDPVALAEVCCGPRSPGGAALSRAALRQAPHLEKALSARGFYPRLADLAGDAAGEVLALAAARHPAASWLVNLSRKIEGAQAGAVHLCACATHPSFAATCQAHAEAGHVEGLVIAAARTGRAEPAAALLAVQTDAAVRAAAATLDRDPAAPILAHFAALYGPEPDPLIARIVPHLKTLAAAEALRAGCRHLTLTRRLLDVVIPRMA